MLGMNPCSSIYPGGLSPPLGIFDIMKMYNVQWICQKNQITFAFPKVLVPLYTRVTCPRHLENLRTLCTCQQQPPFPETCSKECLIFSSAKHNYIVMYVFYQAKKTRKNPKTTFKIGIRKSWDFQIWKKYAYVCKKKTIGFLWNFLIFLNFLTVEKCPGTNNLLGEGVRNYHYHEALFSVRKWTFE